ncbi:MAG: hypothetical protein JKP98_03785 [Rhodobacteraceae bacterium]|nr:hypothetical protein [Paracoccaceae bacterium]
MGLKGRVKSRTVVDGDLSSGTGTTWRLQINNWQATAAGELPMRAEQTREEIRERWGWGDDPFVIRRTQYERDLYGMPTRIAYDGFRAVDKTPEYDNRSTLYRYVRNLEQYIVDKPSVEVRGAYMGVPATILPTPGAGCRPGSSPMIARCIRRVRRILEAAASGQCHRSGILERGGRPALAPRRCPLHL